MFTMSQSDDKKLEQHVNALLEDENQNLSVQVCSDITRARVQALNKAKDKDQKHSLIERLFSKQSWLVAAPLALSAVLMVLVNIGSGDKLPPLPLTLFSQDIPVEDLAMLEELEFATWLAEQKDMVY
jgi:hypothetical protein